MNPSIDAITRLAKKLVALGLLPLLWILQGGTTMATKKKTAAKKKTTKKSKKTKK